MRVLVTGSRGKIGRIVSELLTASGDEVIGFDLIDQEDVRNRASLMAKAEGCDSVVHLAAVIDEQSPVLMETNLIGTWNVLTMAQAVGIRRVVFMSSVNALGIFLGHRSPDYLPIDDDHPSYACRPYALSKRLGEQMCEAISNLAGITTICLRPPAVLDAADYERIRNRRKDRPDSEWSPFWEYGAFLDVRDCARAVESSLRTDFRGYMTALLCAADISATRPARAMARQVLPDVQWRGGPEYDVDPYKALVDTSRAEALLGWKPVFRWQTEGRLPSH